MKNLLVIILLLLFATPALAEGPIITTGGKTGSYIKVGHNLKALLGTGEVITSKGSVENLDRLVKGEAQIGLVQMDAYAWYALKHPEVETELEIMGSLYEECAYLAVNTGGKVLNEDDLQSVQNATIAIGSKGSGTAAVRDQATIPSTNSVATTPAAQIHMPVTMSHLRPITSDRGPVQS